MGVYCIIALWVYNGFSGNSCEVPQATQAMYDHCYGMNGDSQPTNHHGNFHGNRTTKKFHDITRGTVSWKPDRICFGIFPKSGTKQRGIEIGIYPFFVSETWAPKISKNTIAQRETDEIKINWSGARPLSHKKIPAAEKVELKNLTTQWLIIWGYCFSCRFTSICGINPDFSTGSSRKFHLLRRRITRRETWCRTFPSKIGSSPVWGENPTCVNDSRNPLGAEPLDALMWLSPFSGTDHPSAYSV